MTLALAPLRIGPLTIDAPVLLAPMSGVTDMPFRRLVRRFGAGLVYSEMIASSQMVRAHRDTLRMSTPCADEFPMAVQLAGNEPSMMAEAARMNADRGAALIDINMGCPVKKVVKGYAGSALMRDEVLAGRILESVVRAVDVPVTLKMRLGWDDANRNAPTLARIAERSGIALITVHGRTRCQMYTGHADWTAVRAVREATPLPLVVNGDITGVADARAALAASGADGVMIGRACQGRPWLLGQVARALAGGTAEADPAPAERHAILREHVEMLLEHYGTYKGLRVARKHVAWAVHGLPGAATFREEFNREDDAMQAQAAITAFFAPIVDREAA
ncbi:MAG: tRNA-dihydrouridine synthase [Rhodospirillaceae bacterium BRH_c57]|nr:MAG: tRNA-dihydrouridine synthase [Rhodospirillaceae bacterium BRH_c57]